MYSSNLSKRFTKLVFQSLALYGVYMHLQSPNNILNRISQSQLAQNLLQRQQLHQQYYSLLSLQPLYAECEENPDTSMDRPYLGCSLRSMIDKEGMVILMVNTESPGWQAGLKVGDIILEIDGAKVNNINDYYMALAQTQEKTKKFKLLRNGEERTFVVKLM